MLGVVIMESINLGPGFSFLGYETKEIVYKRDLNEELEQIRISVLHKEFNESSNIYSLLLEVRLSFPRSKDNYVRMLGGFSITDKTLLERKDINIVSIFAATLFPFMRTLIHQLSLDDRGAIKLPIVDLRQIDVNEQIVLTKKR